MARNDLDYEYEDIDVGKRPRVVVKKKGGLLGKIVALLLGFILGIVASVGGVIGAGYFIVTQVKIKDATDMIGGLAGIEIPLSDYLAEEYSQNTVLNLVQGIGAVATKLGDGSGTLNDLKAISPYVETLVKGTDETMGLADILSAYGIEVDGNALMNKYIVKTEETAELDERYLTDYIMLKVNDMPLGDVISMFGYEGNDMLTALCYGLEDVDYKIVNGEYVMLGGNTPLTLGGLLGDDMDAHLNKLPLDVIMNVDLSDGTMCTLAYGAAHRYTVSNGKVKMNQLFYTYEGGQFYDDNGELLSLKGNPIEVEGQANTHLITLSNGTKQLVKKQGAEGKYYAFTTDQTPQIVRFAKTRVGDLQDDSAEVINQITLKDALDITSASHKVLYSIAYDGETPRTIGDLRKDSSGIINGIKLTDVIPVNADDAVVMYLLYGKKDVHYSIDPTTKEITPLKKRVALYNGKVFNEYGEPITDAVANGTTEYTVGDKTYGLVANSSLGTVGVKITSGDSTTTEQATLYYVQDNGVDVYYTPTTLGDMQNATILSNLTGRLTLSDVMDVGEHKLLKHLANETIDDLPDAINNLTIDDAFGDQFYYRTTKGTYRLNENGQAIDSNGKVVADAKLIDIKGAETTNKDAALTGTWKYLLMDRKADGTFTINHHHTITEMDSMMDYLSNNVHDASIRELKLDGIVKDLDDETVNRTIITSVMGTDIKIKNKPISEYGTTIGDLTVEEMMLYMSAVLALIDQ